MSVRLEHANLCVRDVDGMAAFLHTAFPEFRVRAEGRTPADARTRSRSGSSRLHPRAG